MAKRIRVGLLFGGESPEHEISIRSAATIVSLLDPKKYQIFPIGITKDGKWRESAKSDRSKGDPERFLRAILKSGKIFREWEKLSQRVDMIFPCLHGPLGEDGTIQGLCELLHLPYAGCGVLSSALGMDKSAQKRIFNHQGLPVLESYSFERWSWKILSSNILEDIRKRFTYPVFVKPCRMGSSIGVMRAAEEIELEKAIAQAFRYDTKIIVEKGIENAREFEVAVMGNELPEVSPVGESISSNPFFDFEAKYVKPSEKKIPAEIPENMANQMRLWAGMAYMAIDCKGFARVDFLGKPDLSEVCIGEINTIPGFTKASTFLKLWETEGQKPEDVLGKIIRLAFDLKKSKENSSSFQPSESKRA